MNNVRKKICIVATIPMSLNVFMKPHIAMLAEQYDVTLIANGSEEDFSALVGEHVRVIPIDIARAVSLMQDLLALLRLFKIFKDEQFDAVHSITPKAGLLAMLAALAAGVPVRIHTFTGQVWANKSGVVRWGLKTLDKLIAKCATGLLTDSSSQRLFLINQNIVQKEKLIVLGSGSVAGVDVERFKPNLAARQLIRSGLDIPEHAIICLYLGRLNADKGVQDLAVAFASFAANTPYAHLMVVGPDESGMSEVLQKTLINCSKQYHRIGFTNKPEDYMAAADIFCLPSYREGFGSVLIEAAAAGVPAIASNIYGIIDAVVNGQTGILHDPKNVTQIAEYLQKLIFNNSLRKSMSVQGMIRAKEMFATNVLVNAMRDYYAPLLPESTLC
jgi:glycosyltransferase involved in cell wall biosynthesis